MRYVGYVACIGKVIVHSFCSGNTKRKTTFGRHRHRKVGNNKTDIQ